MSSLRLCTSPCPAAAKSGRGAALALCGVRLVQCSRRPERSAASTQRSSPLSCSPDWGKPLLSRMAAGYSLPERQSPSDRPVSKEGDGGGYWRRVLGAGGGKALRSGSFQRELHWARPAPQRPTS